MLPDPKVCTALLALVKVVRVVVVWASVVEEWVWVVMVRVVVYSRNPPALSFLRKLQ